MSKISQVEIMKIIEDAGVTADLDMIREGKSLTDAGVDSLDLANVLLCIEEKYDIKIPDEDIEQLDSVSAIIDYLQKTLI